MKLKVASFGAIGALVVASYGTDAHANWFRTHGAACMGMSIGVYQYSNPEQSLLDDVQHAVANDSGYAQEMMCAPPDSSFVQRFQYRTINVEVYSNDGGSFSGELCESFWNGLGGSCSNSVSTNGSGHQTILLGGQIGVNGAWTSSSEANFGYVYVSIPGGGSDNIRGIFYST